MELPNHYVYFIADWVSCFMSCLKQVADGEACKRFVEESLLLPTWRN